MIMSINQESGVRSREPGRIFISLVFLLIFSFISCGKKGPLKLEPRKLPTAITNLSIRQIGNNLKLQWNFPKTLSDKKTRLDFEMLNKIRVYYASDILPPKKFKKKSTVLMKLTLKGIKKERNYFFVTIPFKTRNLDKKQYSFAIRYIYQKKKSPLSTIKSIKTVAPIKPISDLTFSKENKLIKLKWSRPKLNLNNKTISTIAGYKVYRKIKKGNFIQINKQNIPEEYYEDKDTGRDGEYIYYISTITSNQIESDPSNIISVTVKDIYPPDSPHNLISFKAKDHIFLTWNHVEDLDLDFYKIFRKIPSDSEFKLIAQGIRQNYYRDTAVQKGRLYIYSITAIDKKGNESQASNTVEEEF